MPDLFLFGGPNGAGKTTISKRVLGAAGCDHFVNADIIAQKLNPDNVDAAAIAAGRIMLQNMDELAKQSISFGIETTLAARSFANFVKKCKTRGYRFHLIYMWLASPELAVQRVANRVLAGGHGIPSDVVGRRYERGRINFRDLYLDLADTVLVFDNSGEEPRKIAEMQLGDEYLRLMNVVAWNRIVR